MFEMALVSPAVSPYVKAWFIVSLAVGPSIRVAFGFGLRNNEAMPIRFRCVFCNQLMGISRRKAGTIVRCPVCASSITVPTQPDGDSAERSRKSSKARRQREPSAPLFERSDFDDVFSASGREPSADRTTPPPLPLVLDVHGVRGPTPALADPIKNNGMTEQPTPLGIVLTPRVVTLLSVAAIVAVALAFTVGLWVGAFVFSHPR